MQRQRAVMSTVGMGVAVALALAAVVFTPAVVCAHSQYANDMPHGNDVPGCSAIGHGDCSGGGQNAFGDAFSRAGLTWTHAVCAADSDGDGFSNGDELGDVCCWWTGDGSTALLDAADISQPGSSASRPTSGRVSCLTTPPPPTDVAVVAVGGSRAELHWTPPPVTSACVCYYELHVAPQPGGGAGANVTAYTLSPVHVAQASSFVLCGLTPNTTYAITARAVSVGGSSAWAAMDNQRGTGAFTTLLTNTTLFDLNTTVSCSAITALGGSWPADVPTLMAAPVMALLVITAVVCACGPVVLYRCCRRARGNSETTCVESLYDTCALTPVLAPPRSAAGNFVCGDVSGLSVGAALLVSVFIALLALRGVYSYVYWHAVGPASGMEWGRVPADMAQLTLAFAFAPLWKHSVWARWAGLSYDALLTFHRWLGAITVLLIVCHGCGMLLVYTGGNALNTSIGLYGFLAGCGMVVIGVTSLPPVRRASYRLFALAHWLFVPTLFLALLHNSDTIAWLAPAMVLGVLDFALLLRDLCRSVRVTQARVWPPPKGTLGNSFVELHLTVDSTVAVKPARAPFVLLYVPRLSLVPHPFSCVPLLSSAAPDGDDERTLRVRVLMKVVGPFTRRVLDELLADADAPASAPAAVAPSQVAPAVSVGVSDIELQPPSAGAAPAPGPGPASGQLWRASKAFANGRRHVTVFGPFGKPKVDVLDTSYAAVLLIGGGVGVTPLLSLAHAAVQANVMSPRQRERAAAHAQRAVVLHWTYRTPDDDALWHALETTVSSVFGAGTGAELVVHRTASSAIASPKHAAMQASAATYESKAAPVGPAGPAGPIASPVLPPAAEPGAVVLNAAARTRVMPAGAKLVAADVINLWHKRFSGQQQPVRIAVAVCGPAALTDDVRRACAHANGDSDGGVTFVVHTEAFAF